jgi:hypothetical protein
MEMTKASRFDGTRKARIEGQTMREMIREAIEAECLRLARDCPGCDNLRAVKIARRQPSENGFPNWYVEEFLPQLSPAHAKEVRLVIIKRLADVTLIR